VGAAQACISSHSNTARGAGMVVAGTAYTPQQVRP